MEPNSRPRRQDQPAASRSPLPEHVSAVTPLAKAIDGSARKKNRQPRKANVSTPPVTTIFTCPCGFRSDDPQVMRRHMFREISKTRTALSQALKRKTLPKARTTAPAPVRPMMEAARFQAAITARVGVDHASAAEIYRKSISEGNPLSSRALAHRTGLSQTTALRIIGTILKDKR